jgi:hypothetical protein
LGAYLAAASFLPGDFLLNEDCDSVQLVKLKSAINMAWEHGGADVQSRFDKSTAQAEQMKEGALRVL